MQTPQDGLMLTSTGFRDLQAELERLRTVRRREIAERLRQAVTAAGDLGDNLEFLDAEREQEMLEGRIALLEERLGSAQLLEAGVLPHGRVALGCWAEIEDLDTGERSRFVVVNSAEANPGEGRLSIESPVGSTIAGHAPGETLEVATPHGRRHLRIVAAGADGRT